MNGTMKNPHGGDIYKASRVYGYDVNDILDYSANINPFGIPDGLREKIISAVDCLVNYPDPDCTRLREAASLYLAIPEESIVFGNGASEIIFLLFEELAPKKVIIPAPTFSEYAKAASRIGAEVCHFKLREEAGFGLDVDELINRMTDETDAVVICNPNNPTSALVSREALKRLIEHAYKKGIKIIIDEAFIELTDDPGANTIIDYTKEYDNLFVVRAFTKIFAIPGLRLGYGVGNRETVGRLWERKPAWSVNSLACCVGEYLGESGEYLKKTAKWISEEKLWFYEELTKIQGIRVFKPETNFILIKLADLDISSWKLRELCAQRGVLVRDASNFTFLNDRFIRVAIKDRQSNTKFLKIFKELLEGGFRG
ncbi:MAG: threonine-phosphate decarboxylase CobD [Clostridia bacterium]|nr:threonine-phosphate decarboxylase CobD [Clostridia bacterium]